MTKGFFWDAVAADRTLCPAGELLGWKVIEVQSAQRKLRVQFEARPEFLNPAVVQGGFLAAMLDETFSPAIAACLQPGEFPATLEIAHARPSTDGPVDLVSKDDGRLNGRSSA